MGDFTLRDYMMVLFRQKWVVIVTFITVMVTVSIGLLLRTPVYDATVKMLITGEKQAASPYYRELMTYQNIGAAITQSEIVKANPVVVLVIRTIGIKPLDYEARFANPVKKAIVKIRAWQMERKLAGLKITEDQKKGYYYRFAVEDLKDSVKVEPLRDTNMFTITVKDYNPMAAAALANILSRSYAIFDLQQQLAEMQIKYGDKNLAVTQLRDSIDKLTKNLTGQPLPDVEAIGPASVKIIEQAQPPLKPSGIPNSLTFILALFMALFLGVMLAFAFEYMDQTFKLPLDVEKVLELVCLGSIPKKPGKNSYEHIADQICFEMKDRNLRSLMIAAAGPREGVTTAICRIAESVANKCRPRVLIIDANLRKAAIHKYFALDNDKGLVDVLEGRLALDKASHKTVDNITVLTSGRIDMNPLTLLESNSMKEFMVSVKTKYDVVFIDCPNFKEAKDMIPLSSYADSVMFLVSEGMTRKQVARKMAISLGATKEGAVPEGRHKPVFLGAILGNRTYPIPKFIYDRV